MSNIKQFTKEKLVAHPELEEMMLRIENVIYDYEGMSLAEVIGIVDIVKYRLLKSHED